MGYWEPVFSGVNISLPKVYAHAYECVYAVFSGVNISLPTVVAHAHAHAAQPHTHGLRIARWHEHTHTYILEMRLLSLRNRMRKSMRSVCVFAH